VLSIRQEDLRTLAVIYEEAPSVLAARLTEWGVLRAAAGATDHAQVVSPAAGS